MKRMVCEICGSQSIRKESGIFVCQECGSEYSVEDAKKLLQEIDELENEDDVSMSEQKYLEMEKYLLSWLTYIQNIYKTFDSEFEIDLSSKIIYELGFSRDDYIFKDDFYSLTDLKNKYGNGNETKAILKFHSFLMDIKKTAFIAEYGHNDSYIYSCFTSLPKREMLTFKTENGTYLMVDNRTGDCYTSKNSVGVNWWSWVFPDGRITEIDIKLYGIKDDKDLFYKWVENFDYSNWNISNIYIAPIYKRILVRKGFFGDKYEEKIVLDTPLLNSKVKNKVNEIHIKYKEIYTEEIAPYIDEKVQLLNEVIRGIDLLNKEFPIPMQYRNIEDLFCMLELVKDKRVSTNKELLEKYDTDKYRKETLSRLDNIENSINNLAQSVLNGLLAINSNLNSIKSVMMDINANVGNLNIKMTNMNNNLKKINRNTFITMWNTI